MKAGYGKQVNGGKKIRKYYSDSFKVVFKNICRHTKKMNYIYSGKLDFIFSSFCRLIIALLSLLTLPCDNLLI